MSTNGKRNRSAGHRLEKLAAQLLRDAGYPNVVTTRAESKNRDNQGIDLMNRDEAKNGRLPYNIQCKNSTERPKYDQILGSMPRQESTINVILHKYTMKREQKFITRGHYAILDMYDFMQLVAELKRLRETAITLGKELYNQEL
jgi:hypothetical protein